ncbi:hypothetical protein EV401DRAFT_1422632 [Pisolithus croceorrhizus]|nr:hypothetical protein EV401DRAFT_1422632 [Pisolithus croceorrhizus]
MLRQKRALRSQHDATVTSKLGILTLLAAMFFLSDGVLSFRVLGSLKHTFAGGLLVFWIFFAGQR